MSLANPLSIDYFHSKYAEISPDSSYWNGDYYGPAIKPGMYVSSRREKRPYFKWRVVSVGGYWGERSALLEMPSKSSPYSNNKERLDRYWSYGYNERGCYVVRRIMLVRNIMETTPPEQEEGENMCSCRKGHCYCDTDTLTYEINEHSLTVDITRGFRTLRLSLDECAEVTSFLATAKTKIKEAKLAALKEQQDSLAAQLKEVEAM